MTARTGITEFLNTLFQGMSLRPRNIEVTMTESCLPSQIPPWPMRRRRSQWQKIILGLQPSQCVFPPPTPVQPFCAELWCMWRTSPRVWMWTLPTWSRNNCPRAALVASPLPRRAPPQIGPQRRSLHKVRRGQWATEQCPRQLVPAARTSLSSLIWWAAGLHGHEAAARAPSCPVLHKMTSVGLGAAVRKSSRWASPRRWGRWGDSLARWARGRGKPHPPRRTEKVPGGPEPLVLDPPLLGAMPPPLPKDSPHEDCQRKIVPPVPQHRKSQQVWKTLLRHHLLSQTARNLLLLVKEFDLLVGWMRAWPLRWVHLAAHGVLTNRPNLLPRTLTERVRNHAWGVARSCAARGVTLHLQNPEGSIPSTFCPAQAGAPKSFRWMHNPTHPPSSGSCLLTQTPHAPALGINSWNSAKLRLVIRGWVQKVRILRPNQLWLLPVLFPAQVWSWKLR